MKAAIVPRHGEPDVFTVEDRPDPEAGEGEILIDVKAAGVNFADIMGRLGLYPDAPKPPMLLGYEVAGNVAKAGEGVTEFSTGQKVLSMTMFGGYAEKVAVPAQMAAPMPEGLSYEQGAAVPVNYVTAHHMLIYMGNLKPFEKVLVHAVAGGVGTAATQIASSVGAEVIGAASPSKFDYAKSNGATHLINYREGDFEEEVMRITEGRGVDIALDSLGGKQLIKSYNCLAPAGRLMIFGMSSVVSGTRRSMMKAAREMMGMNKFHPLRLMNANKAVVGVNINHLAKRADILQRQMTNLMEMLDDGRIKPRVDKSFPLEEAGEAHRYIQERKNKGKVILKIG